LAGWADDQSGLPAFHIDEEDFERFGHRRGNERRETKAGQAQTQE
jgi:hypothetical protein